MVAAIQKFQHFLVRTDHGALRWLLIFKNPEGQEARWLDILALYYMKINHGQGRVHNNADSLSRRHCASEPCSHCDKQDHRFDTHCDALTQTELINPETLTEI